MLKRSSQLFFLFFLFLVGSIRWANAQIVDDSTRNVYGTHSTRYFLEEDVLKNTSFRKLDTALRNLEKYNYVQRNENTYQDLGNPGTAAWSLFYLPPKEIGFRPGYKSYSLYMLTPADVKYYDTKSPYTRLYYVQSTRRVSFLEGEFSRNITSNWNTGFTMRRVVSNRQIGTSSRTNEREVDHLDYSIFTAFKTKNNFYHLLSSYVYTQHNMSEPGGIKRDLLNLGISIFDYARTTKELQGVNSNQLQTTYHIYQDMRFFPFLHLYHSFDYTRQIVRFKNPTINQSSIYPLTINHDSISTSEETEFRWVENQLGLKGNIDSIHFYQIYLKQKNYKIMNVLQTRDHEQDQLAGAELNFKISNRSYLRLSGETLLKSTFIANKDYTAKLNYRNRFLFINYQRTLYSPSYLVTSHIDNHFAWENKFSPTLSDYAQAGITIDTKFFEFRPSISASIINNYIYFNELAIPKQDSTKITLIHPTLELNFHIYRFHLLTKGIYTIQQGSNVIRLPQIMANGSIYYEQEFKKKKTTLQTGFDIHYQSDYFANGYMPVTQQFFLQNNFLVNRYWTADWFVNVRINKVCVFGKIPYLNMGYTDYNGYVTTPYYFGERRAFIFGVRWMAFD